MWGNVWLCLWPSSHDFSDFILSHLVHLQSAVVYEEPSADLVRNSSSEQDSPGHSEDHVERDAESTHSAKLLVSTQVVDHGASSRQSVGCRPEWQ